MWSGYAHEEHNILLAKLFCTEEHDYNIAIDLIIEVQFTQCLSMFIILKYSSCIYMYPYPFNSHQLQASGGFTPLHLAAAYGRETSVRSILMKGMNME